MAPPMIIAAGVSAAGSLLAGQSAMAAGRFQQSMAERNALILDQKADDALTIGQRNIQQAEKLFETAMAQTDVALARAGVKMNEGTPLAIAEHNLSEFELQKLNIEYDANVVSYDYLSQAANSRMQGELAMYQARQQRTASFISAAGTMVGAYATQNLLNTQATQNAEIIKQSQINNKIITDNMFSNQKDIIDIINNNTKQITNIKKTNSLAFANQFPGSGF